MTAQLAILAIVGLRLFASQATYEVSGKIDGVAHASVLLQSSETPFAASALTGPGGRFKLARIQPGTYTLIVFVPGAGESRRTIDVGPGTADARGRVTVEVPQASFVAGHGAKVSVRTLSIPGKALREYAAADKCLARRDTQAAIAHLEKAVGIAPQFSAAWNHLGTIAYKAQQYELAAERFRRALLADPDAYEPLVNLGGVLLNLGKVEDALNYNVHAVLKRPGDALANSQLGMTYFEMGKPDLAVKHLTEACRLDPGHFSNPQLLLAEIYMRRRENAKAADALEQFLTVHPDWPNAAALRQGIARLRR